MIEARRRGDGAAVPAAAVALVAIATLLLLGLTVLRGATACAWDTSDCAYSAQKTGYYAGRFAAASNPQVLSVAFGYRRDLRPVALRLDHAGRYCLVWAHERSAVAAAPPGQQLARDGYQSAPLANWRGLDGTGPPAGCQRVAAGVPWNRQSELDSAWQFETLIGVAILGLSLLLVTRRVRHAEVMTFSAAILALVVNAALSLTIWS